MALITCPECKNRISQHASNCVHCGWPVEEWATYKPDMYKDNDGSCIEGFDEEDESATDKLAELIKNFAKEYAGLLVSILTQREMMRLYVENDFDDEDLEEKAEKELKDKLLNQTLGEAQKVTDFILTRLVRLNLIKDSENKVHLTEEEQCIINIWKNSGMLLTYENDKLGLMSTASFAIMFEKEYEGKGISKMERAILLKTYLEVNNRKALKKLGFDEEAINEMMSNWKMKL